ncbi:MAG: hypothetical protein AAGC46_13255 [Solirubrobacteraceae bacterium]|nr:hypothetical protein [Patulibacter sp.]
MTQSTPATSQPIARHTGDRAADPFTVVFGGHLEAPDGTVAQADIVISAGMIAEIGSLVCLPYDAHRVDATGSLVRRRGSDAALAAGQPAELELIHLN